MQQNTTVETLIGAGVVLVAAVFLYFAYTSTSSGSLSGYELTARMSRVDGLAPGTDVRLSGIKIGTVTSLELDPERYFAVLHMSINPDIKIPDDSSLSVTSAGVLGSSYLAIQPGGSDKMLAPGERIRNTQGSVDLQGLIGSFVGQGSQPAVPGQ